MKKIIAIVIAALLCCSALAMFASADTDFDTGSAVYTVKKASSVEFTNNGEEPSTDKNAPSHSASIVYRGGDNSLNVLCDGDTKPNATGFSTAGIVTIKDDYTKWGYELSMSNVRENFEDAATYTFTLDYGDKVTFDALFIALYHEMGACISTPGGNEVFVEYSESGATWNTLGSDGMFYYRTSLKDYTSATEPGKVDEIIVPLGQTVNAQYVRLTFSFMDYAQLSPDRSGYWDYYCTVLEWTAFTELGVADFQSGSQPAVMSKQDALATDIVLSGEWIADDGNSVIVLKFQDGNKAQVLIYSSEDYAEDAYNAVPETDETVDYVVNLNTVTFKMPDGDTTCTAFYDGEMLVINDGTEKDFEHYTAPEPPESSDEPVSDEDPGDDSDTEEIVDPSEDVTEPEDSKPAEESVPEESNQGEASGADEASKPAEESKTEEEKGGLGTGAIIGIIAGAVVVVGAAAGIIISKKKKK
ncbi:MAG: hypothetical protein J6252_03140 [Clostridia bacterium]|nr:hypothetical protein [Clostridia bacterium]